MKAGEILFVNVIHPKSGMLEEFSKIQVHDFKTLGSKLDGSISNEFFVSLNEQGDGHCVNVAIFESLEAYYRGTSTDVFKEHIEKIMPLVESTQPMLLKKVWDSKTSEDETAQILHDYIPLLMKQDRNLQEKFGEPNIH